MKREYLLAGLFFAVVAVIFYLTFLVFRPFINAICWGIILVMLFYPLYGKMARFVRSDNLRALLLSVLIFCMIIGPIAYLCVALVDEAYHAYHMVDRATRSGRFQDLLNILQHPMVLAMRDRIQQHVDLKDFDMTAQVLSILKEIQSFLVRQLSNTVMRFSSFVLDLIFIFLTMFFLFRDGRSLVEKFRGVIPLEDAQTSLIFKQLDDMAIASVYSGGIIALTQGFLGGLAFAVLSIASPVFWGGMMTLFSFFPMVGTWIVLFPAIVILLLQGSWIKGLILLGWGAGVISLVDNIIRPWLVSKRSEIHPMVLFFAILGGLQVFGFLGIVLGPMLVSVFIVFLNIFQQEFRKRATGDTP